MKIDKWLQLNKISLNTTKSKFIIFHMPQKRVEIPLIIINNVIIECVANFDFLGVRIDKKLSWNSHTDKISLKLFRCVGIPKKKTNLHIWLIYLLGRNAQNIYARLIRIDLLFLVQD